MAGEDQKKLNQPSVSKFAVYSNAALSAALTSNSLRTCASSSTLLVICAILSASAFSLIFSLYNEDTLVTTFRLGIVPQDIVRVCVKVIQTIASIVFVGSLLAFIKAISEWRTRKTTNVVVFSPSNGTKEITQLTNKQLSLLGLRSKSEAGSQELSKKTPPKTKTSSASPSMALVPLHPPLTGSDKMSGGKSIGGGLMTSPSKSLTSPSMYLVPDDSKSPSLRASPGSDRSMATPWSSKRRSFRTEEDLEKFLADVDKKISESASKFRTPPPSTDGFGATSPNTITGVVGGSGTKRSTPLRPVKMSPGSQKFVTPPKKGEVDLPPPMSMEESIEAFERLGIYPQVEQWRDSLRQWFSATLVEPLLNKIETSHLKVIEAASKLNVSITISQVGSDAPATQNIYTASSVDGTNEWKPAFAVDEEGMLHQLRATFAQALDAALPKLPASNFQQSPQHASLVPVLQEGIDAITEYQRIHALMKGEWGKGLLPQSSVPAEYTVQRIRELAKGTCLKNYEYMGNNEIYEKMNRKWSLELPSDSHLLLYMFCAFLEFPKWMLHIDPSTSAGAQASKNPLFLGVLPPKERFPEKYTAIICGVPSVLHPGACVLAVGKQRPPVFALYWDKKPQFSFQGRTALWDSILLLCHKMRLSYGGVVRGLHLGSPALAILPVLEQEIED